MGNHINPTFLADSPEANLLLKKLKETVTTLEGLDYLSVTTQKHRAEIAGALVDELTAYVEKGIKQGQAFEKINSWAGEESNVQKSLLPPELKGQIDTAVMGIGRYQAPIIIQYTTLPFREGTQFDIGYFPEKGEKLPEAVMQGLITLEKAWFQAQGMVHKSSGIYKADEAGRTLLDHHGRATDVPHSQFDKIFNDPRKGFEAFLSEHGISARVTPLSTAALTEPEAREKAGISEPKTARKGKPLSPKGPENTESVPSPE